MRLPARLFDYHYARVAGGDRAKCVKLPLMECYFDDDKDHAINTEVTEAFRGTPWPSVEKDDWCGEYEPGGPHAA